MRRIVALVVVALAAAGCTDPPAQAQEARPNTVGTIPYHGPTTAEGLKAACGGGYAALDCYIEDLKAYLQDAGAKPAFSLLAQLTAIDEAVNTQSHAIAHALGNYALKVYGTIRVTLQECSYELFQGCLHGAMQAYFDSVGELRPEHYVDLCPGGGDFAEYACVHGLGHGFMLSTRYDLNRTLGMCDRLATDYARGSCHGGSFHENLVAYLDREHPVEGVDHVHGDTEGVEFWIDPEDPYFPCDAVASQYQGTCWLLQTSVILYLNGNDFAAAAQACHDEPTGHSAACYNSLGRDASAHANSACGARATACYTQQVSSRCGNADATGRPLCVRGAVSEVILNFASPQPGLATCQLFEEQDKAACYTELGSQARNMVDSGAIAQLCRQADAGYEDECRQGAGLA